MRLTRKQSLILSGCVIICFFLVAGFLHKANQSYNLPPPPAEQTLSEKIASAMPDSDIELVMGKFHRSETKDGKKLWEVMSKEGRYNPTEQTAQLLEAQLWFYQKDGDVITVTSEKANITIKDAKLEDVKLSDNVIITLNDIKLTTNRARMAGDDQTVTTPGEITIEKPGLILKGKKLRANLGTKEFLLEKDVSTTIFQYGQQNLKQALKKEDKKPELQKKAKKR
ncbi:MAG: LPS export ABC transporter periplasmic protein LptC [Bdellovibrionota bacterium]|jgi:LPS export ABC transporter protein LptC